MSGFNRRVWRVKPPMGTPLASGLFAPDLLAVPFNENAGGALVYNYAIAATPKSAAYTAANSAFAGGKNGGRIGVTNVANNFNFGNCSFLPTAEITILCGWRKRDATLRASTAFGENGGTAGQRCGAHVPYSDGTVYWDFGGAGSPGRLTVGSLTFADDVWCFTFGARTQEIWQNGILRASAAGTARTGNTTNFTIAGGNGLGTSAADLVDWDFFYLWSKQLPQSVIQALSASPFSVFDAYRPRSIGVIATLITGNAAITEAGDTLSAAGTVPATGAAAITEAGDTLSAAGAVPATGAAAITEAGDTVAAVLALKPATGDAAITEGADTLEASNVKAGHASITEAADTVASAGSAPITGNAAIAEGAGDTLVSVASAVGLGPAPDSFKPGSTSGAPGVFKGASHSGMPGGFRPATETGGPGIFKPKA